MTDYARVTDVLRPFTDYDKVPRDILQNAATRGTKVHSICAGMAAGHWVPPDSVDEPLRGYVTSFQLWKDAQVVEFPIIERRYMDDEHGFTGMVDFVVRATDSSLYLVDLKTSAKPQKTYPLQMAAYRYLLKSHGIDVEGSMLVYLKKDGDFPDIDFQEDHYVETKVFFSALQCYKYFHKKKEKGYDDRDNADRNYRGDAPVDAAATAECHHEGD